MNAIAAIAKEVVFSFLREKSFEEGLGFLEYYEVFVDNKQDDPPTVTISIKSIIPGRGLVSPLIEYADRVGKDNFNDELTKYVRENIFELTNTIPTVNPKISSYGVDIVIGFQLASITPPTMAKP